jgi:preprotein translocase subunit SecG
LYGFVIGLLNVLIVLTSLFLICLVLIQRGKGGGLAGAFGGVGGSSAFGTKAGDVFTKVTIGVAAFWIVLSMLLVGLNNRGASSAFEMGDETTKQVPVSGTGAGKAAKGTKAATSDTTTTPLKPVGGESSKLPPVFPDEKTPKTP